MIIKVYIENKPYEIDCDMGTQDIAWLALSACYNHGLDSYPVTHYVPIMVTNSTGEILHPKLVLNRNEKLIGNEVNVKVRYRADSINGKLNAEEKEWFNQAFGNERFFMDVSIRLKPSNDLKRDYKFKLIAKFDIHHPFVTFFPNQPSILEIPLQEYGRKNEMYEANLKLPFGKLKEQRIIFCEKDKDTYEKESTDWNKNEITITLHPNPLLSKEREMYIRLKENIIKDKEISLKQSIRNTEDAKRNEELRLKKLEETLISIPYTLEDIYEFTTCEIQDAEKDLVEIFAILESNDMALFIKLYEIFEDYSKYYDSDSNEHKVDYESMMNFFKNFFDMKDDLRNLIKDFQKLHHSKYEINPDIKFIDFIYIIVDVLFHTQIYKNIIIENELKFVYNYHEDKLKEEAYHATFKNDLVNVLLRGNISGLKKMFINNSIKKMDNYYEMSPNQFLLLARDVAESNEYDYLNMTKDLKFLEDINFFDFLEKVVAMAKVTIQDKEGEQLAIHEKLELFLDGVRPHFDLIADANKNNTIVK